MTRRDGEVIGPPDGVEALYEGVGRVLDTLSANGRKVGDCLQGVYLFYDYDGESIYVGQTREKLRVRIGRAPDQSTN